MKRFLSLSIVAALFLGLLLTPGCDSKGFNVTLDNVKESLFNTAINWALVTISEELGGDKAPDRIAWIEETMEENLNGVIEYADELGLDWRTVVEKAYYLVFSKGTAILKSKLATPEYEGADPILYMVLEPDDFSSYKSDILAHL